MLCVDCVLFSLGDFGVIWEGGRKFRILGLLTLVLAFGSVGSIGRTLALSRSRCLLLSLSAATAGDVYCIVVQRVLCIQYCAAHICAVARP